MKITNYHDNKEYTIEVESLPAYFKGSPHCIKVNSENECLWVTNEMDIKTHDIPAYFLNEGYEPSTPEEFNAALANAIRHIKNLNKQK
jgi:hypothetical protein